MFEIQTQAHTHKVWLNKLQLECNNVSYWGVHWHTELYNFCSCKIANVGVPWHTELYNFVAVKSAMLACIGTQNYTTFVAVKSPMLACLGTQNYTTFVAVKSAIGNRINKFKANAVHWNMNHWSAIILMQMWTLWEGVSLSTPSFAKQTCLQNDVLFLKTQSSFETWSC